MATKKPNPFVPFTKGGKDAKKAPAKKAPCKKK